MAINIPISSPLTQSQAELTYKIGSMKSLLSLSSNLNLNIPKSQQISTFDYLVKIMNAIGIQPEIALNLFLNKVFDVSGSFLEEKVIFAVADAIGEKGRLLPNLINNSATEAQKKQYKKDNRLYLSNLISPTFLQAYKQQIAKNLTLMIFGPKNSNSSNILNSNSQERNRLIEEAICGENLFSLSSEPISNPQNVEYNKTALRKQLEEGQVIFEISCQKVKISLPEDPTYIFEGGGLFSVPGANTTNPANSLNILVQYVQNQTQKINNEQNSNSAGKTFQEILILKLLNYASSLVFPFLGPIFSAISNNPAALGLGPENIAYSNCVISNTSQNQTQNLKEKQEFFRSLANGLLKELLRLMLILVIKEFKKLVSNYFLKTEKEKQKRKAEKIKRKFELFNKSGQDINDMNKVKRYSLASSSLDSILN